jgi:ketosteroid isomerase-like protein
MSAETATKSDLELLRALNDDYIHSVQHSDVRRFDEILAEDFYCTLSDASFVDRAAFLEHTAHPAEYSNLQVHDVFIRIMGDFALIHARTTFTKAYGSEGGSRYTDIWTRQDGTWLCISAQITRS